MSLVIDVKLTNKPHTRIVEVWKIYSNIEPMKAIGIPMKIKISISNMPVPYTT